MVSNDFLRLNNGILVTLNDQHWGQRYITVCAICATPAMKCTMTE